MYFVARISVLSKNCSRLPACIVEQLCQTHTDFAPKLVKGLKNSSGGGPLLTKTTQSSFLLKVEEKVFSWFDQKSFHEHFA